MDVSWIQTTVTGAMSRVATEIFFFADTKLCVTVFFKFDDKTKYASLSVRINYVSSNKFISNTQ